MASPLAKSERNQRIRELAAEGRRLVDIAAEFGISRQRVDQIVQPEKHRARQALNDAVHRGAMERPGHCERCGSLEGVQGHHADHSDTLAVEWLCAVCHSQEHPLRVAPEVRTCPVCDSEHERMPSEDAIHCSQECAVVTGHVKGRITRRRRRAVRVRMRLNEVGASLRLFVKQNGYVPGSTAFAAHFTGHEESSIRRLCQYVDNGQKTFGSYAGTMDAIYGSAGYFRPTYGAMPLPDDSEAA